MKSFLRYIPYAVWTTLGFCAAIGVALLPVFQGLVISLGDSDSVSYYYPIFDFYSRALHAGDSFLWIPGIYSGFPIYLSQVGGFFDPINILIFSLLSGIDGVHARLAIDFLLIFTFSYLAGRALGLSRVAASLVGPSYLMAFHWRLLSNPLTVNALFVMPLLTFVLIKAAESGRHVWKYLLLGGVGLGIGLLGGYTQIIFYAILFAALLSAGRFFLFDPERTLRRFLMLVLHGFVVVGMGCLISLPQILPALSFVPFTVRSEGLSYYLATLKVINFTDLLLVVLPDYFYLPYVTAGRKPMFVGSLWFFIAIAVGVACTFTIWKSRIRSAVPPLERWGMLIFILYLFALACAIQWSPIFYLMHHLPVFNLFRFPFRFMYVGTFFLALLGGIGFDLFRRYATGRVHKVFGLLSVFGSLALVVALAVMQIIATWWSYDVARMFGTTPHYRDALVRGLAAYREFVSLSDPRVGLPLALLLAGALLFYSACRRPSVLRLFPLGAATLVATTYLVVFGAGWRWSAPPSAIGVAGNALTSIMSEEDAALYRFYSFQPTYSVFSVIPPQYQLSKEEGDAMSELLVQGAVYNTHIYGNMASIDGYDQFLPREMLVALGYLGGEIAAGGDASYGARTPEEKRDMLLAHLPLFGSMGGKYIVSGMVLSHPDLILREKKVFTQYAIPLWIYEYRYPVPRYRLVSDAIAAPHKSFSDLIARRMPGTGTYLDCTSCTFSEEEGELEVLEHSNGRYVFSVRIDAEQYLVLSEEFLPGWKVYVDTVSVPIVRANGLYMAVVVPPGTHRVVFEYRGMLDELSILTALGIVRNR